MDTKKCADPTNVAKVRGGSSLDMLLAHGIQGASSRCALQQCRHPRLTHSTVSQLQLYSAPNSSPHFGCHGLQSCGTCFPCAPATGLCTGVGYDEGYQAGLAAGHLQLCKTSCATQ